MFEAGSTIFLGSSFLDTPGKINMEHTNHPFREENDLNQTSMIMEPMLIFQGVCLVSISNFWGCIRWSFLLEGMIRSG